jgi:tetratricopeptide (TPR) repeat protein
LLTEPRVLIDYLVLWFVPRSVSTGLYNDGYVVSTSVLSPLSTLPSLLFVLLSPLAAWLARRRAPALAAAVLFFAAGHLLESTVVPLELYFEHRNYIPTLLLCWPLARSLARWRVSARARTAVGAAAMLLLAMITFQRTLGWGDPDQLARLWAIQNPESARAQATLAMSEARAGDPVRAMARIDAAWRRDPVELQLALNYANAACLSGRLPAAAVPRIGDALRQARQGLSLASDWLANAISVAGTGDCEGLGLQETEAWLKALEANPLASGQALGVEALAPLHARLALQRGDPDEALRYLERALAARATPDMAALQATMLARAGHYRQALTLLDYFETLPQRKIAPSAGMPWLHQRILERQGYWPREMAILRSKLREEIGKTPPDQRGQR